MPDKPVLPVGGTKEAPLRVVGGSGIAPDQKHTGIYTPDSPEFHYYTELLGGFFERLGGWNEILDETARWRGWASNEYSDFEVQRRPEGSIILPRERLSPLDRDAIVGHEHVPLNRVIVMTRNIILNKTYPKAALHKTKFSIRPGKAGEHLLTDPVDGKTIDEITIDVDDQGTPEWRNQYFNIETNRQSEKPGHNYREAKYWLIRKGDTTTLQVANGSNHWDALTDEMVTDLFDTIHDIIEKATFPTPQTERRATPEPQPLALPHPGRRLAAGQ